MSRRPSWKVVRGWPQSAHLVFWAEKVTVQRFTRLSLYFMVHGFELPFLFDLSEAAFLVLILGTDWISTARLLAFQAQQLQKHIQDLEGIKDQVLKACITFVKMFEVMFKNWIVDNLHYCLIAIHPSFYHPTSIQHRFRNPLVLCYLDSSDWSLHSLVCLCLVSNPSPCLFRFIGEFLSFPSYQFRPYCMYILPWYAYLLPSDTLDPT